MREQDDLKEKTAKIARLFFSSVKDERPFDLRRSFEKDLAKDISIFVIRQIMTVGGIPVSNTAAEFFAPSSRKKVSGP